MPGIGLGYLLGDDRRLDFRAAVLGRTCATSKQEPEFSKSQVRFTLSMGFEGSPIVFT